MENTSTANPDFIDEVVTTLESVGEIAAFFRLHAAAGNRSYEFFDAVDSFLERIDEFPPQTSVSVFRASQITMGSQSWYHDFEDSSHKELENELRGDFCWGHPVAVGVEPDWHDSTTVISAVKPFDDGRVELGIY